MEELANYSMTQCHLCAYVHRDTLDPPVKYQVTIAMIIRDQDIIIFPPPYLYSTFFPLT